MIEYISVAAYFFAFFAFFAFCSLVRLAALAGGAALELEAADVLSTTHSFVGPYSFLRKR